MNQELEEKTQQWMRLERKTLRQREEADNFYEKKMMKLIIQEYIQRNQEKVTDKVDYLIVSVGTSYEPIVLNISLLKPQQILFLYTDKTKKYLDKIVKTCRLELSSILMHRVHDTNPLDIYREIKHAFLEWGRPEQMYIDFTGGTKSMSAAAAMAGAMVNVQLVYIGTSDYLADFRKPMPGSEEFYYIANPLRVFGDLEIEKAVILFDEKNFAGTREKLEELKERVPDPSTRQQLNFLYLLAGAYEQWDSLDFCRAYESMQKLNFELKRDFQIHADYILMDYRRKLQEQGDILGELNDISTMIRQKRNLEILTTEAKIFPLIFTMYTNAMLRERQEKYDMAALLLYRVLEMIEQRRLAKYNLFVSGMRYDSIDYSHKNTQDYLKLKENERLDKLKVTVMQIKKLVFGRCDSSYLPDRVSLLEGYIILLALNDAISMQNNGRHIDKIKRLRSMVYLRNNSIFAHGLGPVSYEDYTKFRSFVTGMLQEFCTLEEISFEKFMDQIEFVNPMESKNYNVLGV